MHAIDDVKFRQTRMPLLAITQKFWDNADCLTVAGEDRVCDRAIMPRCPPPYISRIPSAAISAPRSRAASAKAGSLPTDAPQNTQADFTGDEDGGKFMGLVSELISVL